MPESRRQKCANQLIIYVKLNKSSSRTEYPPKIIKLYSANKQMNERNSERNSEQQKIQIKEQIEFHFCTLNHKSFHFFFFFFIYFSQYIENTLNPYHLFEYS